MERGQPGFGRYLKETRARLGLSLRKVEELTEGRVRNAFLSQIENGQVRLPNVDLLSDLADVYDLDLWALMWQAGYRMPKRPPDLKTPAEEGWRSVPIRRLEELKLTDDQLREVLDYADFVKHRGRRRSTGSR
jgi:HTH-type transcriptional regulator, competence development regulator